MFLVDDWWFTPLASVHGEAIDRIFVVILIVTGVAFVAVQGLLAVFVARYGERGEERAGYWHDNPKAEAILIGITAVTLTVLVFMGQFIWADIYFSEPPEDALVVEVTGMQFQWVFRYPGPDGEFGETDTSLVTALNNIGLNREGAGADDIMVVGLMHAVQNRPVTTIIRSIDVIHDFHVPQFRVKQDAVPGLSIQTHFIPTIAGEYEVACAELCGLNHYSMSAALTVDATQEEFDAWLEEQLAFQ
jgi:cytochrome c oxidase subunit 2